MLKPLDTTLDAPWRQRFRAPQVAWSQVATQNPQRGVVCTDRTGTFQLYAWNLSDQTLMQVTDLPNGVLMGAISADGQTIYYLHETQGNAIGHLFSVSVDARQLYDLTPDLPAYASYYVTESFSGNALGFMMVNQNGFQIYVVDNASRKVWLNYQTEHVSQGPVLSYNAELAAIATTERNGGLNFNIELYETQSGQPVADLWDGPDSNVTPVGFSPIAGDKRLLAQSNASGNIRPFIYDPQNDKRETLALESLAGDIQAQDWSQDGERLLLAQTWQARTQLYLYHLGEKRLTRLEHPDGAYNHYPSYFAPDGRIHTHWTNHTHPLRLIALDGNTGQYLRDVITVTDNPPQYNWRSITFTADDAVAVQAWLATPEGAGPFPTVVHAHGGPTDVQMNEYHPGAQVWLEHGFAYCSINYRGSTTFGKPFEQAILGKVGQQEVADLAAGAQWLVDQGIAQEGAVFITGASYGGYLTLRALAMQAGLWAGGMALVAIADWAQAYSEQADALRDYVRSLFGGTPDEVPDAYTAASVTPLVGQIQAPLLVIQGRNDPRNPAGQMQAFVDLLQAQGKTVQLEWVDAAHDPRAQYQREHQQALMLQFAYGVVAKP